MTTTKHLWMQELLSIYIIPKQEEAWAKMGDTGNENYQYNEENYWLGYYRALEDIEENLKNI